MSVGRKVGLLVAAALALPALAACSVITGAVESEDGLTASQERYLVRIGMIRAGEHVRRFTSGGMAFEEQGSLLTDVRVGYYWMPGDPDRSDDRRVQSVLLTDVRSTTYTKLHALTYADYIKVTSRNGDEMKVYLPTSQEFAERFDEAVTKRWHEVTARR